LATRVKAHEQGQWVRDAALAHARKQQQRTLKEAA
jgi:ring-1,2-phenylacetyl-CoA epoxidase subunit PaaA